MRSPSESATIAVATNNGDMGGGEVMLLSIAEALDEIGLDVVVVGPAHPSELIDAAADRGFGVVALRASTRLGYMLALARWRLAHREVPLWCNGLVPALATSGLGPRIVHLHQLPQGAQRFAVRIARWRARRTIVPSCAVAHDVPGAIVLPNWTSEVAQRPIPSRIGRLGEREMPVTVGYLGRLTMGKGVDILAHAVSSLRRLDVRPIRLVVGGTAKFGSTHEAASIADAFKPLGDGVELRGWVDAVSFLADVDLLVVPSRLPESFGLVAAEAMAVGTPVIVARQPGLVEVVGGEHPWIVDPGDIDSLTAMLASVLTAGQEQVDEIVGRARRRWEDRFSPPAGRASVRALLAELDQESSIP